MRLHFRRMRCIVAAGLGGTSGGALAFSRWLADGGSVWASSSQARARLIAVHVLEEAVRQYSSGLEAVIRPQLDLSLQRAQLLGRVDGPHLAFGPSAHHVLLREVEARAADLLILGRHANADVHGLVRLGPTARRLLRQLPVPTVVVPADLGYPDFGGESIVLAVEQLEDCPETLRHAQRLSSALGRQLVVAHALPHLDAELGIEVTRNDPLLDRALAEWSQRHHAQALRTIVLGGDAYPGMLQFITRQRPPLVVVPRHRAGLVHRMLNPSFPSFVATFASAPVLVVDERLPHAPHAP